MGTPPFAVASLDALVKAGFSIVSVVTAPDKPAGRGLQLQQSAVKKYAVEKGLHVLQPEKLKDPEFLDQLKKLKADLQVVVAFRRHAFRCNLVVTKRNVVLLFKIFFSSVGV